MLFQKKEKKEKTIQLSNNETYKKLILYLKELIEKDIKDVDNLSKFLNDSLVQLKDLNKNTNGVEKSKKILSKVLNNFDKIHDDIKTIDLENQGDIKLIIEKINNLFKKS